MAYILNFGLSLFVKVKVSKLRFRFRLQGFNTTTKCVLVHYILSEFGHFYLVKLFNSYWTRISYYKQGYFQVKYNFTKTFIC
jgi:hypothetical protein